jgi:hypothetical protein
MGSKGYDIVGDIHGCAKTLVVLLGKLNYKIVDGVYQHPERQVIFLGDFVDRGPFQRDVIKIVRPMIEHGFAQSVMGNHEYNAIAYATESKDGTDYLRKHTPKNDKQHQAFLDAYPFKSLDYLEIIEWFKTLPLWLDLDGLRVIHACWDHTLIDYIQAETGSNYLTEGFLHRSSNRKEQAHRAIETILKGMEIRLPEGHHFHDKDGNVRHEIRVAWWNQSASNYQEAYLGPEHARTHIPDDKIQGDHLIDYSHDEPPVFLGHYWMEGDPELLAPNIACTDYSVAKPGGKLGAYRWSGETELDKNNFVTVNRIE